MPKIILVHLALFAALFGLAMPVLNTLTGVVDFNGGFLALGVMTLLSEVVVIASGVLGRIVGDALGINPLLQRRRSDAVSSSLMILVFTGFLSASAAIAPKVIAVTFLSSLILSFAVVAVLFFALYVKRALVAGQS